MQEGSKDRLNGDIREVLDIVIRQLPLSSPTSSNSRTQGQVHLSSVALFQDAFLSSLAPPP
jgi:hypothetical protein